ncbi:amastin-like protein [Strigomonas culicis]|uniref:Amastin-like protein n=1 Tax=Strigomonas culicis TaxID=28005 RepID=S9W9V6_9TRYP|nr:amastin-like protein [Strigomonas culicis]|eukprot:EPY32640.1 amastin-like protein [Strigomonas culicis]
MACSGTRISPIVYVVLESIVLLLIIFGTAFDQYRLKSGYYDNDISDQFESTFNNGKCVTLWGAKQQCYSGGYSLDGTKEFWENCPARERHFRAVEVLSIVSVGLVALCVVMGFLFLCCCTCVRYFLFVMGLISLGTLCVTWVIVANCYSSAQDTEAVVAASADDTLTCDSMKSQDYRYGAGFGLLVAGCGLQFFNCIIILLPC